MQRITLEVDDAIAGKWNASPGAFKRKVIQYISDMLESSVSGDTSIQNEDETEHLWTQNQKDMPRYRRFLESIGNEAAARGLSQEVLDKLLAEDNA